MIDIAKLRELMTKASDGPWREDGRGTVVSSESTYVDIRHSDELCDREVCRCSDAGWTMHPTPKDWHNAALIVAAVNGLPEMIEQLENAEREAAQAKAAVLRTAKDPRWAAVYAWLDGNKDKAVRMMSDETGRLELRVAELEAELKQARGMTP